ncbi:MAG: hypothetical protein ABIJ09_23390 [Pseudomonadota bacterium]
MRSLWILLALPLTSLGCLERDVEYACIGHENCATQLNQICGGVRSMPVPDSEPCPFAEDYEPVKDHGSCYYPYCTPKDTIECGGGTCNDGKTCVVAKTEDRNTTRLMCLDMDQDKLLGAETCKAVDWLDFNVCGGREAVCVISFERRALNGPDDQYACVPPLSLIRLE